MIFKRARRIEGVAIAATHCSSSEGSLQSCWRTGAAPGPMWTSNYAFRRWMASHHSWDWARQVQTLVAVSGASPQRRHVALSVIPGARRMCVGVGVCARMRARVCGCVGGCQMPKTIQIMHKLRGSTPHVHHPLAQLSLSLSLSLSFSLSLSLSLSVCVCVYVCVGGCMGAPMGKPY